MAAGESRKFPAVVDSGFLSPYLNLFYLANAGFAGDRVNGRDVRYEARLRLPLLDDMLMRYDYDVQRPFVTRLKGLL